MIKYVFKITIKRIKIKWINAKPHQNIQNDRESMYIFEAIEVCDAFVNYLDTEYKNVILDYLNNWLLFINIIWSHDYRWNWCSFAGSSVRSILMKGK